jgi:hypothetical protein
MNKKKPVSRKGAKAAKDLRGATLPGIVHPFFNSGYSPRRSECRRLSFCPSPADGEYNLARSRSGAPMTGMKTRRGIAFLRLALLAVAALAARRPVIPRPDGLDRVEESASLRSPTPRNPAPRSGNRSIPTLSAQQIFKRVSPSVMVVESLDAQAKVTVFGSERRAGSYWHSRLVSVSIRS